ARVRVDIRAAPARALPPGGDGRGQSAGEELFAGACRGDPEDGGGEAERGAEGGAAVVLPAAGLAGISGYSARDRQAPAGQDGDREDDPDIDGDAGRGGPGDVHPQARRVRQEGGEGDSGRAGVLAALGEGCASEPAGAGDVARRSSATAHKPGDRE